MCGDEAAAFVEGVETDCTFSTTAQERELASTGQSLVGGRAGRLVADAASDAASGDGQRALYRVGFSTV